MVHEKSGQDRNYVLGQLYLKRKEKMSQIKMKIKILNANPKCDDVMNQAATPYRAGGSATPRAKKKE